MIGGISRARRTFQAQLALYAASIIVPALVCVAALLLANVNDFRRSQEQQLLGDAKAVSALIDQRLTWALGASDAVGTSEAVMKRDWVGAKVRAERLSSPLSWIVLIDAHGRQLFNTNPDARAVEPPAQEPINIATARLTGRSQVSNLFWGPAANRWLVAVDTPLKGLGEPMTLSYLMAPPQFLDTIAAAKLPDGAVITVVDRTNHVIIRSRLHERFIGAAATADMADAIRRAREGILNSRSLEGNRSVVAYTRSDLSGWTTMVVVPRTRFEAPLYRNLIGFGIVAALATLLGGLAAYFYSRTLGRQLIQLESDAIALGHGEPIPRREGLISNFAAVQAALSEASQELRTHDDRQRLMINELNHRVKNTLATVQSLAGQAFRGNDPDARSKFEERLFALGLGHDLLTQKHWEAVDLAEVTARCIRGHEAQISAEGSTVILQPQAALALCMCLHELTTNSIKYGAMSADSGQVELTWMLDLQGEQIELVWRETGGPPVTAPTREGFGSRLIDRLVRHELAGRAEHRFEPDGLVFIAHIGLQAASRWRNDFVSRDGTPG